MTVTGGRKGGGGGGMKRAGALVCVRKAASYLYSMDKNVKIALVVVAVTAAIGTGIQLSICTYHLEPHLTMGVTLRRHPSGFYPKTHAQQKTHQINY